MCIRDSNPAVHRAQTRCVHEPNTGGAICPYQNSKGLPKPSADRAVGFHRYLDEALRGGIPFTCPRPGCPAEASLRQGRAIDNYFNKLVDQRKKPPNSVAGTMAKNAERILKRNGIFPVRAQLCVSLEDRIWTRIDAIGVRKRGSLWRPVVIELKSTMQTLKNHHSSYDKTCRRRKTLAVIDLPNSERTAHNLQARFGATALATVPEFRGMSIEAVVVLVSRSGTQLYEVPSEQIPRHSFSVVEGLSPASEQAQAPGFMRLPGAQRGGKLIRDYLKSKGFTCVAAGKSSASFRAVMPLPTSAACRIPTKAKAAAGKKKAPSGEPVVGAIVPGFNSYSEARRAATRKRILQIAGNNTAAVLVHRVPGGWGHTIAHRASEIRF